MSFAQYMVLKKGPLSLFVHVTSKKGSYILHMLHKKIFLAESNLNLSFCLQICLCVKVRFTL